MVLTESHSISNGSWGHHDWQGRKRRMPLGWLVGNPGHLRAAFDCAYYKHNKKHRSDGDKHRFQKMVVLILATHARD
jgi:hypothetical protein